MKRAIADGFSFGETPPPWRLPDKLPSEDLIRAGIGITEASLIPGTTEMAKVIIAKLDATYPTYGGISEAQENNRTATWLAANSDLPADLWVQAYIACARSPSLKRMPTPGEFRAFVAPTLERRRRDLDRLRALLAAATGKAEARIEAAAKPAPPPDTEVARLRVLIRSAKMLGQWDRAQERENQLATIEGREPEQFTRPRIAEPKSEPVMTTTAADRPEIDLWKLPVSTWMTPAEKVNHLRKQADALRRLGPVPYADWLDEQADIIDRRIVTDIAEAP